MIGYRQNNRGNYQCIYCTHKSWKVAGYAKAHVAKAHPVELAVDQAKADAQEKIRAAQRAENKMLGRALEAEAEARRLREQCKPKPEQKRYSAVRYCPNCLAVDSVNIVMGQAVGTGGCFRCGNTNGQLVEHVNVQPGDYKISGGE